MQEAGARVEAAEAKFGIELSAALPPFQDCYARLCGMAIWSASAGTCAGKHGPWGRLSVLPDGHEDSMEEPH
ncbi:hypothetical protein [Streptomyces aureus]|uniref:hypothetical protein n=1 Tax=Streptomyces aureus TaxID=193461 RepID=UPI00068DAEBB|nr:hypothetical protein [Streptomyces aureus]